MSLLPRGIGRIGFVALLLAGGLLVWRWSSGNLPGTPPHGTDPVVGHTLLLSATTPLPGRVEPSGSARQSDRPHLVNLFASWCVPCRVEAPALAALTARGIRIDGIAVKDDPAAVALFLKRSGDSFADVRLDRLGRVQTALGVSGLPETYVVDARGVIRYRHRGALGADNAALLMKRMR